MAVVILLFWLISLWASSVVAKRKGFAHPVWAILAVFFGPLATLYFYLVRPEGRVAQYLESQLKVGPKTWPILRRLIYAGGAVLAMLVDVATFAPPINPAAECHRQYGYDRDQELACLIVAVEEQKQHRDAEVARRWRQTH